MSALDDELDYITFCTAMMLHTPAEKITAHFGVEKAARLALRYQAELAAGLIGTYHDDAQGCGTCGRKHCICHPLTRSEWDRTLR